MISGSPGFTLNQAGERSEATALLVRGVGPQLDGLASGAGDDARPYEPDVGSVLEPAVPALEELLEGGDVGELDDRHPRLGAAQLPSSS